MRRPLTSPPAPHVLLALALSVAIAACGEDEPSGLCARDDLQAALDAAAPGDTVRAGACRIDGPLVVPAGVTLAGAGVSETIVVAPAGDGARGITLVPGTPAAVARDLTVESSTGIGIAAVDDSGTGAPSEVGIEHVSVRITGGIGIGARSVGTLRLANVDVTGPFSATNADSLPPAAGPETGGALGLVLIDVGTTAAADLVDVTIAQAGPWGAIVDNSTIAWQGGSVSDVVGTGMLVQGGRATMLDATIERLHQGIQPLPAYGLAITAGADVTTERLVVRQSDGVGLLQNAATAAHVDLTSESGRFGGVWVQRSPSFALVGTSRLTGNGLSALTLLEVADAHVSGAAIDATVRRLSTFGERGTVEIGDGIQIVDPAGANVIESVMLTANERVGLLVDVGSGTLDRVTLRDVIVDAPAAALGAIAQDAAGVVAPGSGWDSGVTRLGAAATGDASHTTALDVPGALVTGALPMAGVGL